ncbi:MAG: hypothetical protein QF704_09545 [Anaerolineales bacterium]|nr:hypothetical protein [Anaerolineales bacterium]
MSQTVVPATGLMKTPEPHNAALASPTAEHAVTIPHAQNVTQDLGGLNPPTTLLVSTAAPTTAGLNTEMLILVIVLTARDLVTDVMVALLMTVPGVK